MNKVIEKSPASGKNKTAVSLSLGVSVCIHLLILLFIGGAVLIQRSIPRTLFQSEVITEPESTEPAQPAEEEPSAEMNPEAAAEPTAGPTQENPSTPTPLSSPEVIQTLSNSPSLFSPSAGGPTMAAFGSSAGTSDKGTGHAARTMTSLFGSKGESEDALVGHFYDLKQTAKKEASDMALNARETKEGLTALWKDYPETKKYDDIVRKFVRNWDESLLNHYFRAPDALSTYQIFFPKMQADAAPKAFDVTQDVKPLRWLVHYKGTVTSPLTGEIRFVGFGDDVLIVRFNQKNVLDACFRPMEESFNNKEQGKVGLEYNSGRALIAGNWIKVTAGESYPMEVLIGECPGGDFRCFLLVQEKDKTYPQRAGTGGPLLPVFQTAPASLPSYQSDRNGPAVESDALIFQKAK